MTAKRTENPSFGTPLRASCLALESAEREHTESLDLSCSLGPTSEKAGRVLGMCRWHVVRTVEFASEFFWAVFSPKIRLGFTKVLFAENFAEKFRRKFRRQFRRQILPANFAGEIFRRISPANFSQANFASEIFCRKTPQNIIWLSSLLSSFGLSCLRT